MRDETVDRQTKTKSERSQLAFVLLGLVVVSSLFLVPFGLNVPPSPFETLHVSTLMAQVMFICAVAMQPSARRYLAMTPKSQLRWLAALFFYVFWVSVSSSIDFAFLFGTFWLSHIMFLIALIIFYRSRTLNGEDPIWMILGLAGLLHLCAFLAAWAIWPEIVRAHGLPAFENIRHLGYIMAPLCAASAILFLSREKNLLTPAVYFLAAAFYMIYTGSRGGAVATVSGLFVIGIFALWHGKHASILRFGSLVGATGALIVMCEFLPHLPWQPLSSRAVDVSSQTGTQMLNGRDEVWAAAWFVIKDNWILGAGPSWLRHVIEDPEFNSSNPHNIALQLLSQWGLIGTLLVLGAVLSFRRNLIHALTMKPDQALVPVAILATMLIHSLVDGSLYHPYSVAVAIIAFASLVRIGWEEPSIGP